MYTSEDIKSALADGELRLFFQPKVCLLRGRVIGAEALIRWCRRDGIIIGPDNFIAIAEAGGVLHSISLEMLNQAIQTLGKLRKEFPGLSLSMNLTPYDLASHNISDLISSHLDNGQLTPGELQVEITESDVMTRFEHVRDDILRLTDMGIDVLMDDFGVGYSSIDRLSQLPFSSLKLDKGVVSRMSSSQRNLNVVRSSISMARELRMTSIAEGVESEGAYNFLVANGCEQAQGFWLSRPLPFSDYLQFLRNGHRFTGSQLGRVHQAVHNVIQFRKSLVDAAFCSALASDEVLESVVKLEVKELAEETRFGIWYYGAGRDLAGIREFDALAERFQLMYEHARELMQRITDAGAQSSVNACLKLLDQSTSQLLAGLHDLERFLLSESQAVNAEAANRAAG